MGTVVRQKPALVTKRGAAHPSAPRTAPSQGSSAGPLSNDAGPGVARDPGPPPARYADDGGAPTRSASSGPVIPEPSVIGAVFYQDASGAFIPLERNSGVQRTGSSALTGVVLPTVGVRGLGNNIRYWEIDGAKSPVRFRLDDKLTFVVRMPGSMDPGGFNLFPLDATKKDRRTKPNPKNRNTPLTIGLSITPAGESSYGLSPLTGLAAGEYCFSAKTSNDCFCFGIDGEGTAKKGQVAASAVTDLARIATPPDNMAA